MRWVMILWWFASKKAPTAEIFPWEWKWERRQTLVDSAYLHGPLTRYVRLRVAHAPGNARNVFLVTDFKWKPLISDPGMHHGTCVTHVPWWMPGSLTRGDRKKFPAFPAHAQPANLHTWQETHGISYVIKISNVSRARFFVTRGCPNKMADILQSTFTDGISYHIEAKIK